MEIYKDIKNYEGIYKVSNYGNVYSYYTDKILKPIKFKTKVTTYLRVDLVKNKKKCKHSIHRLVAEAFIENVDNKPCVNHIDNDASNNHVDNLEWCTHSENLLHAQKQGRLYEAQSKGGITTTNKLKKLAVEDAHLMVDKVYGTWKVLVHTGTKTVSKTLERHTFNCKCISCGSEKELTRDYLKTEPKQCRNCDAIKKSHNRYLEAVKELVSSKLNNWTILEITKPTTTIRSSKLVVKCECGHNDEIPYGSISKKQFKKCPNCKLG